MMSVIGSGLDSTGLDSEALVDSGLADSGFAGSGGFAGVGGGVFAACRSITVEVPLTKVLSVTGCVRVKVTMRRSGLSVSALRYLSTAFSNTLGSPAMGFSNRTTNWPSTRSADHFSGPSQSNTMRPKPSCSAPRGVVWAWAASGPSSRTQTAISRRRRVAFTMVL